MVMRRNKFDAIWWVAAALALLAVVAADGGIGSFSKLILPVSLGTALAIAAFLSLFVRRGVPEQIRAQPFNTSQSQESSADETLNSLPQGLVKLDTKLTDAVAPGVISKGVISRSEVGNLSGELFEAHRKLLIRIRESQGIVRQMMLEKQVIQRRNVLAEAVEIAKKLSGTGVEVLVNQEDCILIRERQSRAESKPSRELPESMPSKSMYLN